MTGRTRGHLALVVDNTRPVKIVERRSSAPTAGTGQPTMIGDLGAAYERGVADALAHLVDVNGSKPSRWFDLGREFERRAQQWRAAL